MTIERVTRTQAWWVGHEGLTGNSPCAANWDAATEVVVVMRPPEVFVRELSAEEGSRLKSISKKAKYQSKRQRAIMLLASASGMSAPQIAAMARTDELHVRRVIHAFSSEGFGSLDPDYPVVLRCSSTGGRARPPTST